LNNLNKVTEQGIHKRLDKYEEIADAVMVINARINGCGLISGKIRQDGKNLLQVHM
jgi:hypothetical protein